MRACLMRVAMLACLMRIAMRACHMHVAMRACLVCVATCVGWARTVNTHRICVVIPAKMVLANPTRVLAIGLALAIFYSAGIHILS